MKAFIEIELFAQDLAQLNRFCTNITNEVLPGLGNMVFWRYALLWMGSRNHLGLTPNINISDLF